MMCCGKLRVSVCIDCARTKVERSEHTPPKSVREGELCLRMVENRDRFALLFITAFSNIDAMVIAAEHWGPVGMSACPVKD